MPMLAPNLIPGAMTSATEMRISFNPGSNVTSLGNSISDKGVYQTSDGTAKDPLYVVKDGDKIRKFWRSPQDVKRITRYLIADKLWLDGGSFLKAQWYNGREQVDKENQEQHQVYNIPPLVSAALTDLTCGGGCTVKTGIPSIDRLLNEDLNISAANYNWIHEASIYGMVGVQVNADIKTGELKLNRILPHHLFPQFAANKDPEPLSISKRIFLQRESITDWDKITDEDVIWGKSPNKKSCSGFVFEERHFKGMIENYLWIVDGDEIVGRLPLKYFDPDTANVILTGLMDFAITLIPNEQRMTEYKGDWDDIIPINRSFNDRASRVNELLNKYESPNLVVGENQATLDPLTNKTYYRTPRDGTILVRPQDKFTPTYLQPGADTSGSESNLDFLLRMIFMITQMAPALLDPTKMDGIESGVAYKMKLTPTLAKVNRRKINQQGAIKKIVFGVLGALNVYCQQKLVTQHLKYGAGLTCDDGMPTVKAMKYKDAMNRLGESGARVSLESFDELFQNIQVLSNQPRGIFLQDPSLAQTPEELEYLADQKLLDFIATKETEIQELIKLNEIDVEFTPSLPQDKAQALERMGGKPSMSTKRFLTEFDDMSDAAAQEEMNEIRDEEETLMSEQFAQGIGSTLPMDDPAQQPTTNFTQATNLQSDKFTAGTTPTA